MSKRYNEDQTVDFRCSGDTCPEWEVGGRFNAEGQFESFDGDDQLCPECGQVGWPVDDDIEVADL